MHLDLGGGCLHLNTCINPLSSIYTKVKHALGTLLSIFCTSLTFSKRRTMGNIERNLILERDKKEVVGASKFSYM